MGGDLGLCPIVFPPQPSPVVFHEKIFRRLSVIARDMYVILILCHSYFVCYRQAH
jgi:hypothetical protein